MPTEINPFIDAETVQVIRETGKTSRSLPDRIPLLEQYGLPYDRKAENVVIAGCQILSALPGVITSLARVFDHYALSYTFLSEEICCGNYLYRPANPSLEILMLPEFVRRVAEQGENN